MSNKKSETMSNEKIIDFETAKRAVEFNKMKKENERLLTRIALTSNSATEYIFMDSICKLSESSRKIVNDPVLKQKQKSLLKNK